MSDYTPTDIVALFHSTFHPTKGNMIDWSQQTLPDLSLDGVEFSSLPSGLHLVEEEVIYFTREDYQGVCIFRRRKTEEDGFRGARLGAVGLLVAKSARPRPWKHLESLKRLSDELESHPEDRSSLSAYFEKRRATLDDGQGSSDGWTGWAEELAANPAHPVHSLPQVLRLLGPTSMTFFKHVLARKRIMIYTHPAAELACAMSIVGAEICFGQGSAPISDRPTVLGMVGLTDMSRLTAESAKGNGWIACTTDRLFRERAQMYDLLIDLTTPTDARIPRPLSYTTRQSSNILKTNPRLQQVRFTFSDLKVWAKLDKVLQEDPSVVNGPQTVSDLYEELCVMCAGFWIGGLTGRSKGIRMDGEDDTLTRVPSPPRSPKPSKTPTSKSRVASTSSTAPLMPETRSPTNLQGSDTVLSLLSIFHQHAEFVQARVSEIVAALRKNSPRSSLVIFYPRDISALELSPLSELDCAFFASMAECELGSNSKVVLRRSWRDIAAAWVTWT